MSILHLEDLRQFAVRDVALLHPGDEVLFCHVPSLAGDPREEVTIQAAYSFEATLTDIKRISWNEEYPKMANFDAAWASKPEVKLFYSDDYGPRSRFASDSGVILYPGGYYNPVNFTLRKADLAEVEYSLEVSEEYSTKLNEFNSKITIYPSEMDYFD